MERAILRNNRAGYNKIRLDIKDEPIQLNYFDTNQKQNNNFKSENPAENIMQEDNQIKLQKMKLKPKKGRLDKINQSFDDANILRQQQNNNRYKSPSPQFMFQQKVRLNQIVQDEYDYPLQNLFDRNQMSPIKQTYFNDQDKHQIPLIQEQQIIDQQQINQENNGYHNLSSSNNFLSSTKQSNRSNQDKYFKNQNLSMNKQQNGLNIFEINNDQDQVFEKNNQMNYTTKNKDKNKSFDLSLKNIPQSTRQKNFKPSSIKRNSATKQVQQHMHNIQQRRRSNQSVTSSPQKQRMVDIQQPDYKISNNILEQQYNNLYEQDENQMDKEQEQKQIDFLEKPNPMVSQYFQTNRNESNLQRIDDSVYQTQTNENYFNSFKQESRIKLEESQQILNQSESLQKQIQQQQAKVNQRNVQFQKLFLSQCSNYQNEEILMNQNTHMKQKKQKR